MAQLFKGLPPSDAELDTLIEKSNEPAIADEPLALSARYDRESRRIILELANGSVFIFPVDRCQGLADAPDDALANVKVMPGGDGLGWADLDVHYNVGSLVVGAFGGREWMRQLRQALAKEAGTTTSLAKAKAARENGKKGGRPRKAAR